MSTDPNRGLLPGEDFDRRVLVVFSRFNAELLLEGLDALCQTRLRALLSQSHAKGIVQSGQFSNAIKTTPSLLVPLVDRGLPLDVPVWGNFTALGVGLISGDRTLVKALLDRGASLDQVAFGVQASAMSVLALSLKDNIPDRESETVRLAKDLIALGASVEASPGAVSPMVEAARAGSYLFAEVLLEAGASMARDVSGRTPLQIARAHGHTQWIGAVRAWQEASVLAQSTDQVQQRALRRTL